MKKIRKFLVSLTLCISTILATGCSFFNKNPDGGYEDTGIVLAENGKTEYSVVIPENPSDYEQFAASELRLRFEEATGAELALIYDNNENAVFSENAKLISISDTTVQKASGVTAEYETYKRSGARMVTKGSCVILTGGTEQGALYAVYDFLKVLFNYEYFDIDTYRLEKKDKVTLPKLDESNIPDMDYRIYSDYRQFVNDGGSPHEAYRMRLQYHDDGWTVGGHAVDVIMPYQTYAIDQGHYDWYDSHGPVYINETQIWSQLCYTNEDMRQEFVQRTKTMLEQKPEAILMGFGQSDVNTWCECENCLAAYEQYAHEGMVARGAITQTLFVNKVVEEVEEWLAEKYPGRQVRYMVFSYHQTVTAPAHKDENGNYIPNGAENGDYSMKLHDKVYVSYADIYANRNLTWRDNPAVAENLKAWAACTKSIQIYEYATDSANCLLPYDGLQVHAENYRFAKELGFSEYFHEGAGNGTASGLTSLKYYVASKLMWDTELNVNDVVDEWIEGCFGEAADEMKEYYDLLRVRLSFLRTEYGFGHMVLASNINAAHWPRPLLLTYYGLFDEMYEEIEYLKYADFAEYERLCRKIDIEKLFLDLVNLSCYLGYYSTDEKVELINSFEENCSKYGAKYLGSGKDLASFLANLRNSL